jgi:hypothetical protein
MTLRFLVFARDRSSTLCLDTLLGHLMLLSIIVAVFRIFEGHLLLADFFG